MLDWREFDRSDHFRYRCAVAMVAVIGTWSELQVFSFVVGNTIGLIQERKSLSSQRHVSLRPNLTFKLVSPLNVSPVCAWLRLMI